MRHPESRETRCLSEPTPVTLRDISDVPVGQWV